MYQQKKQQVKAAFVAAMFGDGRPVKKRFSLKARIPFFVLLGLNLVALAFDFHSTVINKELYPYLESNPLYNHVGLIGILIFNLFVLAAITYSYLKVKYPDWRFVVIVWLVFTALMHVQFAATNYAIHDNPPPLELAKQVTPEMKQEVLKQRVFLDNFGPLVFLGLSYLFFRLEHRVFPK